MIIPQYFLLPQICVLTFSFTFEQLGIILLHMLSCQDSGLRTRPIQFQPGESFVPPVFVISNHRSQSSIPVYLFTAYPRLDSS